MLGTGSVRAGSLAISAKAPNQVKRTRCYSLQSPGSPYIRSTSTPQLTARRYSPTSPSIHRDTGYRSRTPETSRALRRVGRRGVARALLTLTNMKFQLLLSLLTTLTLAFAMQNQLIFDAKAAAGGFTIASSDYAAPLLIRKSEPDALHVAVKTFAEDVERVTGVKPKVYIDTLPKDTKGAIVVSTVGLAGGKGDGAQQAFSAGGDDLAGKWESYRVSVVNGQEYGAEQVLAVTGSDKVRL